MKRRLDPLGLESLFLFVPAVNLGDDCFLIGRATVD